MFVFISFGGWVVAFGDGVVPYLRIPPQFLRHWGLPRCSPFGRNVGVSRIDSSSRRSPIGCLLGGGLVGVEPVGGGAVACGEAHATVVGILHLGNDDVLHLWQFARHHVEVQLVVHLQNHA